MQPANIERKFTIFIMLVVKQSCNVYVFTCYVVVLLAVTSSAARHPPPHSFHYHCFILTLLHPILRCHIVDVDTALVLDCCLLLSGM
jgi:hypothetical protein